MPHVHAAENNTIRLALIGCGGRGSGAVGNAMNSPNGPVKLVAMADVVEPRLARAHRALGERFSDRVDVPKDRQFVGFDAYRKAIDCLGPGDVAMLTNFAAFRPMQLEYAVAKGVNVFMEKSFAPDVPGLRRLLKAGEAAQKKNLKIAAGLQWRHSENRQELIKRIRAGEMGELQFLRAYRVHPCGILGRRPPDQDELLWQIRNFTNFLWVSGGLFAEMNIHQIDELCWIKDAWPVAAHGIGGRAANSADHGQNLDSLSIEWTFPDGTKAYDVVRWLGGHCHTEFATYIHGTRCAAQFNTYGLHVGETARLYKDQRITKETMVWEDAARPLQFLGRRVERAAGEHSQRQTAERDPACSLLQRRGPDGPGGRSLRQDDHLGRGHGFELPVLPEHRRHGLPHSPARPGRRRGTLSGACARGVDRDLTRSGLR